MNIVFVCSCLESSKDGVGDYTRRLAGELIRQGHNAGIVALHDSHIDNFQHEIQIDQNSKINTLRLSTCISWRGKKQRVKKFIDDFDPEWLSLQFVSYGFHKKGLPFLLPDFLVEIGGNRKWHIMFHELWIGHDNNILSKNYWIGLLQKQNCKKLISMLGVKVINTNTRYYNFLLENAGINNKYLPLISNFYFENSFESYAVRLVEKIGFDFINENRMTGLVFGSTPINDWGLELVLDKWESFLIHNNLEGFLFFCGKNESLNKDLLFSLMNKYTKIDFYNFGVMNKSEISTLIQCAQFCINPTPLCIYEKSGVIKSMVQHGIPVILTRKGSYNRKFDVFLHELPIGINFVEDIGDSYFANLVHYEKVDNLKIVVNEFIDNLK